MGGEERADGSRPPSTGRWPPRTSGVSFYEGLLHVRHPEPPGDPTWNYWVLAIGAAFDGGSWLIGLRELRARRRRVMPDQSLWTYVHATKDPSVLTIVFEDTADLAGLLLAFLGVFLGHRLGVAWLDGAASMAIGVVLAVHAHVHMQGGTADDQSVGDLPGAGPFGSRQQPTLRTDPVRRRMSGRAAGEVRKARAKQNERHQVKQPSRGHALLIRNVGARA